MKNAPHITSIFFTNKTLVPLILVFIILVSGSAGYEIVWKEYNSSFVDNLYMTVITITTLGYHEVYPLDDSGRVFTMVIAVTGIGSLFYLLGVIMENLVIFQIYNIRGKKKMMKKIDSLENHIILVGYGRVGGLAADELKKLNQKFVVISDKFEQPIEELSKNGILAIEGDATEDAVLIEAKIQAAKGIIVATASSSTTVFVVLSSRVLNPNIFIVARADEENVITKLKKAGANQIVNPYAIGGARLANIITNPNAVKFFDESFGSDKDFNIDSITLPPKCPWNGKNIVELDIRKRSGATILAIVRDGKSLTIDTDFKFEESDQIVAFGTRAQLKILEGLALE